MEITSSEINDFAEAHTGPEPQILYEIWRQSHLKTFYPNMVSGKLQGKLLQMLMYMLRPDHVLEIGTFTGYSAVAMALAMPEGSHLITIDNNEEIESMARRFIREANLSHRIQFVLGDALSVIPALEKTFDFVFMDADKEQYPDYYQTVFPFVKKGGFLLADNVLWGGKVLQNTGKSDKETAGIKAFNEMVKQDDRVEKVMLPVRDGLYLIRKRV